MTSIGLISDVHATPTPIEEALSIFKQAGVEQVFCAGDIAGYGDQLAVEHLGHHIDHTASPHTAQRTLEETLNQE